MPIIMNWLSFVFFDFIFQLWSSFWLHRLSINGCSTGSGSNYDIFIIFESEFKFRIIYGNQFQLTMRLVININLRLHFHSNIRSTFNYYYFILTWNWRNLCMLMWLLWLRMLFRGWKRKLPRYVKTSEENLQIEMETGVSYTYLYECIYYYSNEIENVDCIPNHQTPFNLLI